MFAFIGKHFLSVCLYYIVHVVWCQQNFNPRPRNQRTRQTPNVVLPRSFTPRSVREAFNRAEEIIAGRRSSFQGRRNTLAGRSRTIPAARHLRFQASMPRSRRLEDVQERFEEATRVLLTEMNLTPDQILFGLAETDLRTMLQGNEVQGCEAQFNITRCNQNDRYRTFDGTCNNLRHPSWGMAASCFERLVEPEYSDGVAEKRTAMSGNPLPEPRRLSLEVHSHFDNPTDYVTHMFMAWGQFLVHDITLAPQARGADNELLDCCPTTDNDPPSCDPIILQGDDPFFRSFNITCLSNVRSAMCSTCSLGPRQQTNQVTSYIDASHIYGLNREEANGLRANDGSGTLRVNNNPSSGELLPESSRPNEDECSFQDPTLNCFEAGDQRVNQHPALTSLYTLFMRGDQRVNQHPALTSLYTLFMRGDQRVNQHPALTSLHTLFMREHNRVARRLREVNSGWDDERLFQEARRIVGAEIQMIAYNEYLPLTLGPERMEWFDLSVRRNGEFTQYDETVQATLANEFSVAACRFGHSMINSFFQEVGSSSRGNYLRDIFNFPFGLYSGQMETMMEGLTQSPSQKFDRYMVRDVTNHLYQNRGNESGLDLAALNINRGRDHGVPGYTALVEFCGGPTITRWRDLDRLLQRGMRQRLESLYERVEDIDLFTGGLAERPNQGAVIGPTFTCIIGIQFYHIKYGDRFYFEHGGQTGSFTPAQLRELKKVTLGKIMCDNLGITEIPTNVFLYEGNRNRMENCDRKEGMDLNAWRA